MIDGNRKRNRAQRVNNWLVNVWHARSGRRESFGESGESGDDDAFESKEDFGDDDDPEEVEEEDAWKRRRKER